MKLGLVITCHTAYLHYLPKLLAAWDAQADHLDERVLVLDGVDDPAPAGLDPAWKIVRGAWGNPNPARNAGWLACACDWIIGWDADNLPPPDFARRARVAAARAACDVGVLAAAHAEPGGRVLNRAVFEHADPRDAYVANTAAAWRREAVLHAGGWQDDQLGLDDWTLAKTLHVLGWRVLPLLGVAVTLLDHAARRTHTKPYAECLWRGRRVGIIALLSGRMHLIERWFAALHDLERPPHCGLTLVTPADRPDLRLMALRQAEALDCARVTVLTPPRPALRTRTEAPESRFNNIHRAVGALYAHAIAATPEELVLTWEDDVFPHDARALAQLSPHLRPAGKTAAVAAAYPSRSSPEKVVAATGRGEWTGAPVLADLPRDKPMEVGNVGCGFTLWNRVALEACPILGPARSARGGRLGLDGAVCRRMTSAGWKLKLHGGVRCDHETGGTDDHG